MIDSCNEQTQVHRDFTSKSKTIQRCRHEIQKFLNLCTTKNRRDFTRLSRLCQSLRRRYCNVQQNVEKAFNLSA